VVVLAARSLFEEGRPDFFAAKNPVREMRAAIARGVSDEAGVCLFCGIAA